MTAHASLRAWWHRCADARRVAPETLLSGRPAIVLAPHPDDETLGCGGLLAAAASGGVPVRVVAVTDGAGSHPGSRSHPPARLGALRRRELGRAMVRLGLPPLSALSLGLPDGAAPDRGAAFERAVRAVLALARHCGAGSLFATWQEDPHCDHRATARLAAAVAARLPALRLFSYPLWARLRGPEEAVSVAGLTPVRIDMRRFLAAKRRAVAAYRSQLGLAVADDPGGFVLPPDLLRLCLGPEELFLRHDRDAIRSA